MHVLFHHKKIVMTRFEPYVHAVDVLGRELCPQKPAFEFPGLKIIAGNAAGNDRPIYRHGAAKP